MLPEQHQKKKPAEKRLVCIQIFHFLAASRLPNVTIRQDSHSSQI